LTQGNGRNELGAGVAGDPELGDLGGATPLQTEFVELDVRQIAELPTLLLPSNLPHCFTHVLK
jgi:hypothetical protein